MKSFFSRCILPTPHRVWKLLNLEWILPCQRLLKHIGNEEIPTNEIGWIGDTIPFMKRLKIGKIQGQLLDLLPRCGQIARRYFHAEDLPKEKKGKHDFVTAADLAVNQFLQDKLAKLADIPILSEETASDNLDIFKMKDFLWVIDPLDGTANFSRGDSNFSISVALVRKKHPVLGVIFEPIASRLYWANSENKYAYWNGRRIQVSKITNLEEAVVCTDWSHILKTRDKTTDFLKKIYGQVRQIKILGSAATDIITSARGKIDIYYHVHLFPWDVAAAGLIAQKAGAEVTDTDGKPWHAFSRGILVANQTLHRKILKFLNK